MTKSGLSRRLAAVWFGARRREQRAVPCRRRVRLEVECLEDRVTPSIAFVATVGTVETQTNNSNNGWASVTIPNTAGGFATNQTGQALSGIVTGDVLIVEIALGSTNSANNELISSVTDSANNLYIPILNVPSGGDQRTAIYSAYVVSVPTSITVNLQDGPFRVAVSVNEFSGIGPAPDQTASGVNTSTSTPTSAKTAQTTQASELLMGAIGFENDLNYPQHYSGSTTSATFTAGAGYTAVGVTSAQSPTVGYATIAPEYQIVSTEAQYSAGGTLSNFPPTATTADTVAEIATFSAVVGPPDVWTGAVSTDWSNPANWSLDAVPTATTDAIIPGTNVAPNQPVLSQNSFARTLIVENGAALNESTYSLTVSNAFFASGSELQTVVDSNTVYGTLVSSGTVLLSGAYLNVLSKYNPASGDKLAIIQAGTLNTTFGSTDVSPFTVSYGTSKEVVLDGISTGSGGILVSGPAVTSSSSFTQTINNVLIGDNITTGGGEQELAVGSNTAGTEFAVGLYGSSGLVWGEYLSFGSTYSSAYATGVALYNGNIYVAGTVINATTGQASFAIASYSDAGVLNSGSSGFTSNGYVITSFTGSAYANNIAISSSGTIAVVGDVIQSQSTGETEQFFAVEELNTSGTLVNFKTTTTSFYSSTFTAGQAAAEAAVFSSATELYVAGYAYQVTSSFTGNMDFALAAYNTTGLDTTSGTNFNNKTGWVTTDFGGGGASAQAIAVEGTKLVLAGYSVGSDADADSSFALARYSLTGALDTSFSSDGMVTSSFGSGTTAGVTALLINSNSIDAVGYMVNQAIGPPIYNPPVGTWYTYQIAAAQYTTAGVLDSTFNPSPSTTPGQIATSYVTGNTILYGGAMAVASPTSGQFLVAGAATDVNANFYLATVTYDPPVPVQGGFVFPRITVSGVAFAGGDFSLLGLTDFKAEITNVSLRFNADSPGRVNAIYAVPEPASQLLIGWLQGSGDGTDGTGAQDGWDMFFPTNAGAMLDVILSRTDQSPRAGTGADAVAQTEEEPVSRIDDAAQDHYFEAANGSSAPESLVPGPTSAGWAERDAYFTQTAFAAAVAGEAAQES